MKTVAESVVIHYIQNGRQANNLETVACVAGGIARARGKILPVEWNTGGGVERRMGRSRSGTIASRWSRACEDIPPAMQE